MKTFRSPKRATGASETVLSDRYAALPFLLGDSQAVLRGARQLATSQGLWDLKGRARAGSTHCMARVHRDVIR